jgi:1-acyl-sn-glycerol-3-phosphate acyltransferase
VEARAAFRLARVGLHLLWGTATVATVYPWAGLALRRALKRHWSRQLVGMLGVKVGAGGTAPIPPGLLVSNHVSWLDIYVINALAPAAFVSKEDVKHWPLIGWLCARTETIFLERGSRAAAQRTRETMIACLRDGAYVAVFPEGTTTDGSKLLSFHAALFQSAIDAGTPVVPLALRYVDAVGWPSRAPAYDGDVTLWECLRAIARAEGLTARIEVLAPLDTNSCDRRHLAAHCHRAIAAHLETPIPSPPALPPDRRASGTHAGRPDAPPSDCLPTDSPNPAPATCPSA